MGWMSYDPTLNLVYYGTSNPGPWNSEQRPGDNKWSAGVFARDADTGEAVWFYQVTPHDLWDYDAVNESILLDLPIDGATRKILLRAERDGYVYVIDPQMLMLSADRRARHLEEGFDIINGSARKRRNIGSLRGHRDSPARRVGRLAAERLLAAQPAICTPRKTSHGLRGPRATPSRHAVCGARKMYGARRPPRAFSRGILSRAERSVDQGELPVWSGTSSLPETSPFVTMDGWFRPSCATVDCGGISDRLGSSANRLPSRPRWQA